MKKVLSALFCLAVLAITACHPSIDTNEIKEQGTVTPDALAGYSTQGLYLKNTNVVILGMYPQSMKEDNIIIDEGKSYTINNWKYYLGNDGYYYVKQQQLENKNYYSNGKKASELIPAKEEWVDLYFKLEPIRWRILTKNYKESNKALLVPEKVLDAGIEFCDYSTSNSTSYYVYDKDAKKYTPLSSIRFLHS